jgi:hypothetical protein
MNPGLLRFVYCDEHKIYHMLLNLQTGKILSDGLKFFPLEALANLSICHPEHSEGSVLSTAEADPSLRSG